MLVLQNGALIGGGFNLYLWEIVLVSLDNIRLLRWLYRKRQVIGERHRNGAEIQFIIAKTFDVFGLIGRNILVENQTRVVTKEVVETARQNLIIGPD